MCRGCGAGLDGEPVLGQRRHQVTDIAPVPAPKVTEYVAQAKACPCCGTVSEGVLPSWVRTRVRKRLADEVRALRGANATAVIRTIAPIVRGWSAYYRGVVSTETFHTPQAQAGTNYIARPLSDPRSSHARADPAQEKAHTRIQKKLLTR